MPRSSIRTPEPADHSKITGAQKRFPRGAVKRSASPDADLQSGARRDTWLISPGGTRGRREGSRKRRECRGSLTGIAVRMPSSQGRENCPTLDCRGPRTFAERFYEATPPDLPTAPGVRADSGRHKGGSGGCVGSPREHRSCCPPRASIATGGPLSADGCRLLPRVGNSAPACVSDRRETFSLVIGGDVCQYQCGP